MTVTKTTNEARQGQSALRVRNVLVASMTISVMAALALFLTF